MIAQRMPVDDLVGRKRAVDPERSVLVQAPAGSGKTTLLVLRFLKLLARVSAPEEILAITFTNKAAASMRERVLGFLYMDEPPEEKHELEPFHAAQAIKGQVKAWGLKENPSRLRIMTIDSFCARLVKRMPVVSGLGQMPVLAKYPEPIYRAAARRVVGTSAARDPELRGAVDRLLLWRDNDIAVVERLIAELLPAREKWLRVVGPIDVPDRLRIEAGLREVVFGALGGLCEEVERGLASAGVTFEALREMSAFCASNLGAESVFDVGPDEPVPDLDDPRDQIAVWREFAQMLLTQSGTLRSRLTKREGFPAGHSITAAAKTVLGALAQSSSEAFVEALVKLRDLPDPFYGDEEWGVVADVIKVLQAAAIELEMAFQEEGKVDFSGVSAAALRGLGTEDDPTDLALYLDHAIGHILMDECQDSNWTQFLLLERLVAGWERDDGRTLFLVGDPMQSIYRFRLADVSLFVQAKTNGVGPVSLEFVQLSRNYRSRGEIVEWVNDHIGPAFPSEDDRKLGRIAYAPSVAACGGGGNVVLDVVCGRSRKAEAESLVDKIAEIQRLEDDEHETAILVRSRSHLAELIPALREAGLEFSSLQLDKLIERPVIRDLYALAMALWHPADRAAWLAVLRAPWLGLTLADLEKLFGNHPYQSLAGVLLDTKRGVVDQAVLDACNNVLDTLRDGLGGTGSRPFRDVVESCWRRLGGDHIYAAPEDLRDAFRFMAILDQFDEGGQIEDWEGFERALAGERSEGSIGNARLSIMTVHESKGLEFDSVILPGLDRQPKVGETALLEWLPVNTGGSEALLLSPIRSAAQKKPSLLSKFIRQTDRLMEDEERKRLLYVAATRARKCLIVSASPSVSGDGGPRVSDLCMLSDLWSTILNDVEITEQTGVAEPTDSQLDQGLWRLSPQWQAPSELDGRQPPASVGFDHLLDTSIRFDWAPGFERHVGQAIHRCLELIGSAGIENLDASDIEGVFQQIPSILRSVGSGGGDRFDDAVELVRRGLENTLSDETGRWLLRGHPEGVCEQPISGIVDDVVTHCVMDRFFVDQGTCWIVDWKSASADHQSAGLSEEQVIRRFADQVRRYASLVEAIDDRPVRCGIYLPLESKWVEVSR